MSSAPPASGGGKTIIWLIVGGAPRSGTTALGNELCKSSHIAVLHEYASNRFFDALSRFFTEEERQSMYGGFALYGHLIPRNRMHGPGMVHGIFSTIFPTKPDLRIFGTKTPSYELMPTCKYPEWAIAKTIHITRNPYDVMLSALRKNHARSFGKENSITTSSVKRELNYWISAWNHAVDHADDDNFLHVFYDDLIASPHKQKKRISRFLDGVEDFDILDFKPTQEENALDRFRDAGLGKFIPLIRSIAPYENWIEQAKLDYASCKKFRSTLPYTDRVRNYMVRKINTLHKFLVSL